MSREGEVCFCFVCFGGLKSDCRLFRTEDQGQKLCSASSGDICLLSDLLHKKYFDSYKDISTHLGTKTAVDSCTL